MKTPHALKTLIRDKALELGFSKVGFAAAGRLGEEGDRLHQWLERGFQGTMGWMERDSEKRLDVGQIIPNARSVVSVALNYYTPFRYTGSPSSGKISRYAWGDDYHILLSARIQQLVDCIKSEIPGVQAKAYVDTGPVMDKVWAVRSGLGWIGKHTNLISREYGSWIFLGEIILDAELEYDEPLADLCGTCTACIDACPTAAIVEPYVLDSRLCISYLTIEHKGEIPDALKPQLSNWIFGCDCCQDVCPWNRFQQETGEEGFRPRGGSGELDLEAATTMTERAFTDRFRRSPIKRTKLSGFTRNARAVLEGKRKTELKDTKES